MRIPEKEYQVLNGHAAIYKAVAHPIRLAILRHFSSCGCEKLTVKRIYEELEIAQPVASHHLGILKRCGVLCREQEGNHTYYRVCTDEPIVSSILRSLDE